ncbi:electron transfer flavoprotein subunit alpha/FixB family protein [Vicingus serpentipes]|jgi:electron transfer flavoprotein alpha subunit|uniref:Electron transfer flavoprotein subunit alpha/FixB family protein n=1 Tax=Vicingus serpentipes TaxID=1926625 RepID=A0A5C6RX61_9FLAO|nr:electron transfer flavoprotein subunit alpha/FixB family protein [Vicingus serpentipes]TXB66891.1 electron transfer flavoprotein subunit alpha/FixB family protein [Vicingus serpentipes]
MSILIYADSNNGALTKNAFEAVSYGAQLAQQTGSSAVAIVTGTVSGIEDLGKYGVSKVLHASDASLDNFDPQKITHVIAEAAKSVGADTIIFSHDYSGKSVAPRLAAKLDAGLVTGAISLPNTDGGFIVKKAVFSGKAFAFVEVNSATKIVSVLPNSIEKKIGEGSATVEAFSVEIPSTNLKVKEVRKESTELSLTEADIVVSAGRGLKGPENWGMIEELAKELGAATACSRPVADIGWRPHHEHVGQTGFAIRPNLYFAIGISGAIQHLAGVNGSKVIVAINTDAEAPFFKAADYGIVGDAFEVVPKLIEAIKKLKAQN